MIEFDATTLNQYYQILLMAGILDLARELYDSHYFWEITTSTIVILLYALYYYTFSRAHFLIKPKYDTTKKNLRKPPPPYPNGWYNAIRAELLPPRAVKPLDINGHNIVLFRGRDQVAYALEGYCLHMGAHLGVGGEVVNDRCVQCPFHGWLYDGATGYCVDHDGKALELQSVQYNDDMCKKDGNIKWKEGGTQRVSLRKYPVNQVNGYIYVWISAAEEYWQKPAFPMMDLSSFLNPLSYRGQTEHHINCPMQDIPSNGADVLHFKYVHTYIIPWITSLYFRWDAKWKTGNDPNIRELFEHKRKDMSEFKQRIWKQLIEPYPNKEVLSIGSLENWIHIPLLGEWYMFSAIIIQIGLGVVFVVLKSPLYNLVFHHYVVPVGRHQQQVFHDCFISGHIPYFASSKILELEGGQVTNDMHIWQSKSFAHKTCLNQQKESDIIMRDWLKWSGQFYQGCGQQQDKNKYGW